MTIIIITNSGYYPKLTIRYIQLITANNNTSVGHLGNTYHQTVELKFITASLLGTLLAIWHITLTSTSGSDISH